MKVSSKVVNALAQIGLTLLVVAVIVIAAYTRYAQKMESQIQLKSRYTFTICIDDEGRLVENLAGHDETVAGEGSIEAGKYMGAAGLANVADMWIEKYLEQYTQRFLSAGKSLRKIQIDESKVLDEKNNTVLIGFSAKPVDSTTEYFSSWDGIINDGMLRCEWVVSFDVANHIDGVATVYVESMLTPEEYGIYQYNESIKDQESEDKSTLTGYVIRESALYVTYDGGESYEIVPVSYDNLFTKSEDDSSLREGSYMISTTKTAFMYGGRKDASDNVPVTLIYTDNMGEEWVTCEIGQIYDAEYMYVEFFDENVGVIVVSYGRTDGRELCTIYSTTDGGQTWVEIGAGPAAGVVKGARFIDEKHGFICYEYSEGMDGSMYLTKDGGKTFSKIMFEAQHLDSGLIESGVTWEQVFNEAQVPKMNEEGVLTVNIIQGGRRYVNDGKTVARYQSTDKGSTWAYVGQFEMNTSGT